MVANTSEHHRPDAAVVSIDMGYGHLRAARALADHFGTVVQHVDSPALASADERRTWERTRRLYEFTSRVSTVPIVGRPFRTLLDSVTEIPHLYPYRDLSSPQAGVKLLDRLIQNGLGHGLANYLRSSGLPLVTTFYAPALIADRLGLEDIYCVVTDVDIHRIWAPVHAERTRVQYLVPSKRAARRLRAYGVASSNIHETGFPLPPELLGGPELPALRANLRRRLSTLDPDRVFNRENRDEIRHFLGSDEAVPERTAPHLLFAVGGAGAQAGMVRQFLPSLRGALSSGQLELTLVAGVREEVADAFHEAILDCNLEDLLEERIHILLEKDFDSYYTCFNRALARADILWTKPSEMTFFGALGIPLLMSWPVGVHEKYNRRWAMERGAGLKQRDPRYVGDWLFELLADGTLASAAWSGFTRMPKFGTYRVGEIVRGDGDEVST